MCGLCSLNPKGFCYSYTWSCSLCEGCTSICTGLIFRKLCRFLFMFSTRFISFIVFFLSFLDCLLHLYPVFDAISSNTDEGLWINPSAVIVFEDFNVYHEDWVTCSVGTNRLMYFVINFLAHLNLIRWLTFLLRSLTVTLIFWIYFFLLMLLLVPTICSIMTFPPLGKFSESKVKFRQANKHWKMVIETAKLAYANKKRVYHFPETWLSGLLKNC